MSIKPRVGTDLLGTEDDVTREVVQYMESGSTFFYVIHVFYVFFYVRFIFR